MLCQDVNELSLALIAPLATENARHLAERPDSVGGGGGGAELGWRRRGWLRGADDDASGETVVAEGEGALGLRDAYGVRIQRHR